MEYGSTGRVELSLRARDIPTIMDNRAGSKILAERLSRKSASLTRNERGERRNQFVTVFKSSSLLVRTRKCSILATHLVKKVKYGRRYAI